MKQGTGDGEGHHHADSDGGMAGEHRDHEGDRSGGDGDEPAEAVDHEIVPPQRHGAHMRDIQIVPIGSKAGQHRFMPAAITEIETGDSVTDDPDGDDEQGNVQYGGNVFARKYFPTLDGLGEQGVHRPLGTFAGDDVGHQDDDKEGYGERDAFLHEHADERGGAWSSGVDVVIEIVLLLLDTKLQERPLRIGEMCGSQAILVVDDLLLQLSAPVHRPQLLQAFLLFSVFSISEHRSDADQHQHDDEKTPAADHFLDFILEKGKKEFQCSMLPCQLHKYIFQRVDAAVNSPDFNSRFM